MKLAWCVGLSIVIESTSIFCFTEYCLLWPEFCCHCVSLCKWRMMQNLYYLQWCCKIVASYLTMISNWVITLHPNLLEASDTFYFVLVLQVKKEIKQSRIRVTSKVSCDWPMPVCPHTYAVNKLIPPLSLMQKLPSIYSLVIYSDSFLARCLSVSTDCEGCRFNKWCTRRSSAYSFSQCNGCWLLWSASRTNFSSCFMHHYFPSTCL